MGICRILNETAKLFKNIFGFRAAQYTDRFLPGLCRRVIFRAYGAPNKITLLNPCPNPKTGRNEQNRPLTSENIITSGGRPIKYPV